MACRGLWFRRGAELEIVWISRKTAVHHLKDAETGRKTCVLWVEIRRPEVWEDGRLELLFFGQLPLDASEEGVCFDVLDSLGGSEPMLGVSGE